MINLTLELQVCDNEGDEHDVTVQLHGFLIAPSRYYPGEYPEVIIPPGVPVELHEEIERVAIETFLANRDREDAGF